jgi:hypothetical protein
VAETFQCRKKKLNQYLENLDSRHWGSLKEWIILGNPFARIVASKARQPFQHSEVEVVAVGVWDSLLTLNM